MNKNLGDLPCPSGVIFKFIFLRKTNKKGSDLPEGGGGIVGVALLTHVAKISTGVDWGASEVSHVRRNGSASSISL